VTDAFFKSLAGAGPYLTVFIGLVAIVMWLMQDRTRVLTSLEKSNERLLDEREKRAAESLETAKMLSESTQRVAEHTKSLEKVLDRWSTSSRV